MGCRRWCGKRDNRLRKEQDAAASGTNKARPPVWGTELGRQQEERGASAAVWNGARPPVRRRRRAGHRRGDREVGDDGLDRVGISYVGLGQVVSRPADRVLYRETPVVDS
jgi:hypothetical protein